MLLSLRQIPSASLTKRVMSPCPQDLVTVPPGHKVVVYHASEGASIGRAESGFWIVQCGKNGQDQRVFEAARRLVGQLGQAAFIWIVPAEFLSSLPHERTFLTSLSGVMNLSRNQLAHTVVVPDACPKHESVMQQIACLAGVHYSAEDGACFVEVHKPEGIIVGMPGRAYTGG